MWPFRRKQKPNYAQLTEPKIVPPDPTPDTPTPFGYKTTWWVIKSEDSEDVADSIALVDRLPCNWESGIANAYANGIFVSPPVDGWVFVAGRILAPDGNDPSSECLAALLQLSNRYGDVQVFSTHRVVGYNVWARAKSGQLVPGFGYLGETGETLWNEGDDTTEIDMGWSFFDSETIDAEQFDPESDDYDEFDSPTEDRVMEMASEWSISPTSLDSIKSLGVGWIGHSSRVLQNAG